MSKVRLVARFQAYLELLRVSNVLTPVADIWMGVAVASGRLVPSASLVSLTFASVCLYLCGMVLNDVLDVDQDRQQRPTRPIPSGRISQQAALRLAVTLATLGMTLCVAAAVLLGQWAPVAVGAALLVAILAYDAAGKHPVWMGVCRGLNVLLGFSAVGWMAGGGWIALAMAVYILGVTVFARTEAAESRRSGLAVGASMATTGIALLTAGPWLRIPGLVTSPEVQAIAWFTLWAVVLLLIVRRFVAALLQPTQRHVQSAVGNAIAGVVLIDAALAWGYAGRAAALAIFALYPLTMLLARFVKPT